MSLEKYSKKLFHLEHLQLNDKSVKDKVKVEIWNLDIAESITWLEARSSDYESVLHFFWSSIFYLRDADQVYKAEEIVLQTQLHRIDVSQAKDMMKSCSVSWLDENLGKIPEPKWTHYIWQDANDVFITFEDEDKYYGFNWELTGNFEAKQRFES